MNVKKLYYEDPHIREFTACVTGCEPSEKGWRVTLSATAFYPEGGGQACDLGTLGSTRVLDVREEGEQVVHLCDSPLEVGSQVAGRIDWQRRFDLMQQHTGEHILSGLIYEKYGYHNIGFHVGKNAMEVDFDGPIPAEVLQELEKAANQAVWEDIPLKCWYPAPEELPHVFYRTKRALPWPVRIVQIPGYDSCACCGVHVKRTGEVGLIKILSCTKFHEGIRLEMLCGQRAYDYLCRIHEENRQVSQTFSAKPLQTGAAAQKAAEDLAREKLTSNTLRGRIFAGIAENCRGRENVLHYEQDLTPGQVRQLADAVAAVCSGMAAVFSGSEQSGYTLCIVSQNRDVRALGAQVCQALQGRGGGKPGAFQGSFRASKEEIEGFFREHFVI